MSHWNLLRCYQYFKDHTFPVLMSLWSLARRGKKGKTWGGRLSENRDSWEYKKTLPDIIVVRRYVIFRIRKRPHFHGLSSTMAFWERRRTPLNVLWTINIKSWVPRSLRGNVNLEFVLYIFGNFAEVWENWRNNPKQQVYCTAKRLKKFSWWKTVRWNSRQHIMLIDFD